MGPRLNMCCDSCSGHFSKWPPLGHISLDISANNEDRTEIFEPKPIFLGSRNPNITELFLSSILFSNMVANFMFKMQFCYQFGLKQ